MYSIVPDAAADIVAAHLLPDLVPVYLSETQRRGATRHTIANYGYQLAPFVMWFRSLPAPHLTREAMQDYSAWLKRIQPAIRPATVHTCCRRARQFLRWLHTTGRLPIDISPWLPLPAPPQQRTSTLTTEAIERMVYACKGTTRIRDVCLIAFLTETGCRRIEAANARWENVTHQPGWSGWCYLDVVKGYLDYDKTRTVCFGPVTGRLLQLWQAYTGTESGLIFGVTNSGIRHILGNIAKRAVVDMTAHDLRRTFATYWIKHCHAPNSDLAERLLEVQLGHAPHTVTQKHYLALTYADVAANYVSPFDELTIPGITPKR